MDPRSKAFEDDGAYKSLRGSRGIQKHFEDDENEDKKIQLNNFIKDRGEQANISCKTILVTVFGDVVSQHGGWIWLGSLIESLEPLGFSERLVRTSVFRLVKDSWLQVRKIGRKSFYTFTESANNHYAKAAHRIYAATMEHHDDRWLVVFPSFVVEDKLVSFKRQLKWLGFSTLTSGVYAHPSIERSSLEDTLKELEITDSVVVFSSQTIDGNSEGVLKKLVFEKWDLKGLQQQYNLFIETYQPILDILESGLGLNSQQSFQLRTLLIHEYRRILLKDHELSKNMLPENWQGYKASQIVKALYSLLGNKSCSYIISSLEAMDGSLPKASTEFENRFR